MLRSVLPAWSLISNFRLRHALRKANNESPVAAELTTQSPQLPQQLQSSQPPPAVRHASAYETKAAPRGSRPEIVMAYFDADGVVAPVDIWKKMMCRLDVDSEANRELADVLLRANPELDIAKLRESLTQMGYVPQITLEELEAAETADVELSKKAYEAAAALRAQEPGAREKLMPLLMQMNDGDEQQVAKVLQRIESISDDDFNIIDEGQYLLPDGHTEGDYTAVHFYTFARLQREKKLPFNDEILDYVGSNLPLFEGVADSIKLFAKRTTEMSKGRAEVRVCISSCGIHRILAAAMEHLIEDGALDDGTPLPGLRPHQLMVTGRKFKYDDAGKAIGPEGRPWTAKAKAVLMRQQLRLMGVPTGMRERMQRTHPLRVVTIFDGQTDRWMIHANILGWNLQVHQPDCFRALDRRTAVMRMKEAEFDDRNHKDAMTQWGDGEEARVQLLDSLNSMRLDQRLTQLSADQELEAQIAAKYAAADELTPWLQMSAKPQTPDSLIADPGKSLLTAA